MQVTVIRSMMEFFLFVFLVVFRDGQRKLPKESYHNVREPSFRRESRHRAVSGLICEREARTLVEVKVAWS